MSLKLGFAPHVGTFVAADRLEEEGLLAVCLSAGPRGPQNVIVFDERRDYARVCRFPVPNRARSGITHVVAAGGLFVTGDDHTLIAHAPRTGATVWRRELESARLLDAHGDRLLVTTTSPNTTRIVHAVDGTDEVLEGVTLGGSSATCLGPGRRIADAFLRCVWVYEPSAPKREIELASRKFGVADTVSFDETGTRLLLGTRAGEVLSVDLTTGRCESVLELPAPVRCVGFVGGAPFAMDAAARLRIREGDHWREVDLGLSTYGGLVSTDSIALSDLETRTFRVRALPDGKELFATSPGFVCESVAIDSAGVLYVGGGDRTLRIVPDTGKCEKIASISPRGIERLATGALLFEDSCLWLKQPSDSKPKRVGRESEGYAVSPDGTRLVSSHELVVEEWDLATQSRARRMDLGRSWIGETNEAIRFVHFAPDGRVLVHLSDGAIFTLDAIDEAEPIGRLAEGLLVPHPDGQWLYRVAGREIVRVRISDFQEVDRLQTPVDADVAVVVFSPSGRRLAAFHRNGQVACFDLATEQRGRPRSVVLDAPQTSAAERAPNEIFVIDLQVPVACAFSRDERRIAWPNSGGLAFADVETGVVLGRLSIATGGRAWAVTDGTRVEWSGKMLSSELVVLDGERELGPTELQQLRAPGVLAALC